MPITNYHLPITARVARRIAVAAAFLAAFATAPALALTPAEVAVIANQNSPGSLLVAHHYMTARQIAADHLITINCDPGEKISDYLYRVRIAEQIKAQLNARHLADKVRCLVTTYDVPLHVANEEPTRAELTELVSRKTLLTDTLRELEKATAEYAALAAGSAAGQPASQAADDPPPFAKLMQQLEKAQKQAIAHINALPQSERAGPFKSMFALQERVWGPAGVITSVHINAGAPDADAAQQKIDELHQQVREREDQLQDLQRAPATAGTRDKQLALRTDLNGLVGRAAELERFVAMLDHHDTAACVDNELMMLWDNDYPREGRYPNPLCIDYHHPLDAPRPKVLMVARLDGSTPQRVLEMINTTLETERKGLSGTVYFDARGKHGTDAYSAYDNHIRDAAAYLKDNTKLHVVLDDKETLLQAANCPDAALYCGWYAVHHYQDSCQWLPGSVGYHVASFEMETLHTPGEKGWVVNLLDRGICGTLGPVAEPYLDAFPKPDEFFPLLVSGLYTQAEVYALTCPYVSWQIGYVGDPLYNPYKTHPALTRAQLEASPILRRALEEMPPGK